MWVKTTDSDVVLDFDTLVGKNVAIMLGCRQITGIVLVVWITAAPAAAGSEGHKTRVSVLITAQDVFSRRTAGHMEHLGLQRFEREPGFWVMGAE